LLEIKYRFSKENTISKKNIIKKLKVAIFTILIAVIAGLIAHYLIQSMPNEKFKELKFFLYSFIK